MRGAEATIQNWLRNTGKGIMAIMRTPGSALQERGEWHRRKVKNARSLAEKKTQRLRKGG